MDGFTAIGRDENEVFAMGRAAKARIEHGAIDRNHHAGAQFDIRLAPEAARILARLVRMGEAAGMRAKADLNIKAAAFERLLPDPHDVGKAQAGPDLLAHGPPGKGGGIGGSCGRAGGVRPQRPCAQNRRDNSENG